MVQNLKIVRICVQLFGYLVFTSSELLETLIFATLINVSIEKKWIWQTYAENLKHMRMHKYEYSLLYEVSLHNI